MLFFILSLVVLLTEASSDLPALSCPPGSTSSPHDPTLCYFVVSESNTFQNAEFTCQAHNSAHLPKIKDSFTNYYIGELARSHGLNNIWIGATNIPLSNGETCSSWYWTYWNELLSFSDWAPHNNSFGNCAMVSVSDGYFWHHKDCNTFLPTICQLPAVYNTCDPGWEFFNDTQMCYKTVINRITAPAAEEHCKSKGGHLVSIHSDSENEFVVSISASGVVINSGAETLIRIGLYRLDTDPIGVWHWYDGTNVNYTNWDKWGSKFSGLRYATLYSDPTPNATFYKNWDPTAESTLPTTRGFVCKKPPTQVQYNNIIQSL